MKKLTTILAIVSMSFLGLVSCASSKSIIDRVQGSIVRVTNSIGVCTGFVIAPEIILTDQHCMGPQLTADGYQAEEIYEDVFYDLAVLKVKKLDKKPLEFRDKKVEQAEALVGLGYANGWPLASRIKVEVILTDIKVNPRAPMTILTKGGFTNGMSGGPVVDGEGKVVSIIQRGDHADQTDIGVGVGLIKAFLIDAGIELPQGDLWPNLEN